MPDKMTLAKNFTFASGAAQCLVRDGKPQNLHPWPKWDEPPPPQPVPCAPDEAGYIPNVGLDPDLTRDDGLVARSESIFICCSSPRPGDETGAVMASHGHGPATGGWTVSDEQRFWLA
jgi:hypothetical protein